MSQFAAHKQAGGNAPARTAELTPDPGTTPHRGTAQGFRELRQRLKSPPPPQAPAPPPPVPARASDHASPETPPPRDEPAKVSAEVEEGPADIHAFDLSSLFGGVDPPPMLDFSGLDRAPAGRLLLEGTIPSEALAASEEETLPQPAAASQVPPAAPLETLTPPVKPAELKQLRLPELPAIDEFALVDEPPPPEDEAAAQGPTRSPEPETPAADPPPRAFWQDEESKAEPPLEVAAAIERVNIESEEAGDVARSLLEIMSLPANTTQPQERALAADSLLHLLDRLPLKTLIAMVERLSIMETPPPLILAELIHDARIEVAGPLLEKCSAIDDQDLLAVIGDGHLHSNRMIARRRTLASVICDALIATEDVSAILTLVRNPAAGISHEAFFKLNDFARRHPTLQAPLATRADLPAPIAFELFWVLPAELRRYVISRFLTNSATLNKNSKADPAHGRAGALSPLRFGRGDRTSFRPVDGGRPAGRPGAHIGAPRHRPADRRAHSFRCARRSAGRCLQGAWRKPRRLRTLPDEPEAGSGRGAASRRQPCRPSELLRDAFVQQGPRAAHLLGLGRSSFWPLRRTHGNLAEAHFIPAKAFEDVMRGHRPAHLR